MSTFSEISGCPTKNHEFWSEWARFHLAMMKEHRNDPRQLDEYRFSFRLVMKHRRDAKYFDGLTNDRA